ncbi:hypothetical protein DITRI_Ditri06bG0132700 [Diplodiscus trichospermus]
MGRSTKRRQSLRKQKASSFQGLKIAGKHIEVNQDQATRLNAEKTPRLKTLGISLARIAYAPYNALNPLKLTLVPQGSRLSWKEHFMLTLCLYAKVLYSRDAFFFWTIMRDIRQTCPQPNGLGAQLSEML